MNGQQRPTSKRYYSLSATTAATLAALTLAACGGTGAEADSGHVGAAPQATATSTEPSPAQEARADFALQVSVCMSSKAASVAQAADGSVDVNGPDNTVVINDPKFGRLEPGGGKELEAVHTSYGMQDAWVMPDRASAQRAQAALAPFRDADPNNHSALYDTTVIAFEGKDSGVVQDCIRYARANVTADGGNFALAGQPATSEVPELTAAQTDAALRGQAVATYCEDYGNGGRAADLPVKNASQAHDALAAFLPLFKKMPHASVDGDSGQTTLQAILIDDIASATDKYPRCINDADANAIEKAYPYAG